MPRSRLSLAGRLVLTPVILLAVACEPGTPASSSDLDRWEARAEQVTIIRDDWGIPHIYAPTDADAVFGLMYAQAEDDFPRIERNFLNSQGRLAEAEGRTPSGGT
jgi:acyl-homoserine-lactone acylase